MRCFVNTPSTGLKDVRCFAASRANSSFSALILAEYQRARHSKKRQPPTKAAAIQDKGAYWLTAFVVAVAQPATELDNAVPNTTGPHLSTRSQNAKAPSAFPIRSINPTVTPLFNSSVDRASVITVRRPNVPVQVTRGLQIQKSIVAALFLVSGIRIADQASRTRLRVEVAPQRRLEPTASIQTRASEYLRPRAWQNPDKRRLATTSRQASIRPNMPPAPPKNKSPQSGLLSAGKFMPFQPVAPVERARAAVNNIASTRPQ